MKRAAGAGKPFLLTSTDFQALLEASCDLCGAVEDLTLAPIRPDGAYRREACRPICNRCLSFIQDKTDQAILCFVEAVHKHRFS